MAKLTKILQKEQPGVEFPAHLEGKMSLALLPTRSVLFKGGMTPNSVGVVIQQVMGRDFKLQSVAGKVRRLVWGLYKNVWEAYNEKMRETKMNFECVLLRVH